MKVIKPLIKEKAKQDKVGSDRKCFVNIDIPMQAFTVGQHTWTEIEIGNGSYGPLLPITTTLKSNNDSKTFVSKWTLTPDPNNVDLQEANEVAAALANAQVNETKLKDGARGFKNSLTLPNVGGDKYKIVCTKANQRNPRQILELNVETWRGLWLTVFWTDNSHPAMINQGINTVRKEYLDGYIDLNHVPAEKKLDWDHDLSCLISNVKDDKEDFIKAMHGGHLPDLQRKPFHFHVVLVKRCAKLDQMSLKFKIDPSKMKTDAYDMDFTYKLTVKLPQTTLCLLDSDLVEQVARVRGNYEFFNSIKSIKYRVDMTPEELAEINKKRTEKKPVPVKSAEKTELKPDQKTTGGTDTDKKTDTASVETKDTTSAESKDIELTEDKNALKPIDPSTLSGTITPTDKNVRYKGIWEMAFDPGGIFNVFLAELDNPVPIELEFEIEVADLSVVGQNQANKMVISTHGLDGKPTAELAKTMTHEIGHALGLVPAQNHPDYYTGHGGVGPHCKFNAVIKNQEYTYGGSGKMCVMFHEIHAQAGPSFCKNCMKHLKMTKLSSYYLKTMRGWT